MTCIKCGAELPEGAEWCCFCGRKQTTDRAPRRRGNGQGSVYQLPNGKYKAVIVTGYYVDAEGRLRKRTRSYTTQRKKDAVAALVALREAPQERRRNITFQRLFDAWFPTHRAGKSTLDCYKAAMRYFSPVWHLPLAEIDVDDLQECIDGCPHGRRTKENMRATAGLMYKYGIPRKLIPDGMNLASYLTVEGDSAAHRESFTDTQIEAIRQRAIAGNEDAEAVLCMIYTGFRPSEFLALTAGSYDGTKKALRGGSKTSAGKNRTVTVSPKILPIIERRAKQGGVLFPDKDGKRWDLRSFSDAVFYPALNEAGIDNPMVEVGGGVLRHKYSPHSCRHTFATLMKRTAGAEKDKMALIGHASGDQLRDYQDVAIADLARITDAI